MWYFNKKLVKAIREKGYGWVFASRSNRKTINKKGKEIKLKSLAKALRFSNYRLYKTGERIFGATSRVVVLPGIGTVKLVLSKEQTKGKTKKEVMKAKTKFIATNLLELTDEQILQNFSFRTKIENTFKELKLHLGLSDCQMTILEGIKKHISCVRAAYNFVYLVSLEQNIECSHNTIGRICSYIKNRFLATALNYFFELGKLNKKLDIGKVFDDNNWIF